MTSSGWLKAGVILCFAVLLFGCATTEDVRILDGEIRRLHSQVAAFRKDKDQLSRDLDNFQKEMRRDFSALQTETKTSQTDLLLRLETLQSEVRILSTGVEEYKEYLKRPAKEIDRMREDIVLRTRILEERGKFLEEKTRAQENRAKALEEKIKATEDRLDRLKGMEDRVKGTEDRLRGTDDRLKGLEGRVATVASKQAEAEKTPPVKEGPAEVKTSTTGAGDLYKDAYETFQKGDFEGARRKFEAFLKQYPNTELSDNAQFWIGEIYYQKKDFEKAILEYEKVIVKYPEGDKVPAALFKQGLAFLELGDKGNARNLLKRVIERYPRSEQAETAKKRLEAIK